jgi:geranylgeranyl pyrophosphate synthase
VAKEGSLMGDALDVELDRLAAQSDEPLRAAVCHALLGGKRARGMLLLAAGERSGASVDTLHRAAACIELLHAATLVQDDVFDKSCLRRGIPSVCCAFGSQVAILASDWMLAEAMRTAYALSPAFGNALGMCAQAMMQAEARESTPRADRSIDCLREQATSVARGKTGALFGLAVQAPYLLAGRTDEAERLYERGLNVGVAFQYLDDVLDLYGDAESAGKELGHDLAACIVTMPLVDALSLSPWQIPLRAADRGEADAMARMAGLRTREMREHLLGCARTRWQTAVLECLQELKQPDGVKQLLEWLMGEMLCADPQRSAVFALPQTGVGQPRVVAGLSAACAAPAEG